MEGWRKIFIFFSLFVAVSTGSKASMCSPVGGWVQGTANHVAYTVAAREGSTFMARCDVGDGSFTTDVLVLNASNILSRSHGTMFERISIRQYVNVNKCAMVGKGKVDKIDSVEGEEGSVFHLAPMIML